jgi:hypothetical protein
LSSISLFLESKGGQISFDKNNNRGASFLIKVPIKYELKQLCECILIDDDKFIHLAWSMSAKKAGVKFHSFFGVDDFLAVSKTFQKEAAIYIDSDLGSGKKGEILSKKISDVGFNNIILATSYTDIDISNYQWIKKCSSKNPPF